jgi:ABC-type polysaccharide/polyol phosphate transport system ATPase subunit
MEKETIIEKQEEIKLIKEIRIEKFWNDEDINIRWKLNSDVNILAGDNGTGKSTILQLISGTVKQNFDRLFLSNISRSVVVSFNSILTGNINQIGDWNVAAFVNKDITLEIIEKNIINQFPSKKEYILENIKNLKKGAFLSNKSIFIPDSDIFAKNKSDFNIRIDEIKTVDSLLLDRETIQKISNEEVLTDLDWKVSD